jgi:O-antigen/teichoic acid export membrane protein
MVRPPDYSPRAAANFRINAGLSLAAAVFSRGVIFVLQVCIARWLGVAELNLFVTASVVGATIYLLSDLGLRPASLFIARGNETICRFVVGQSRSLRRLSALIAFILGTSAVIILSKGGGPSLLPASMLIGSYVLQSYSRYLRAPLRAAAQVGTETRIETLEKAIMFLGGLVGLAMNSLDALAAGQLVGAVAGLLLTMRCLKGPDPMAVRIQGSVIRYGLTIAVALGAPMLYSRLDYLVLVRIGDPVEAAVYAASYSLLLGASLLPMALGEAAIAHLGEGKAGHRRYLRLAFFTGAAGATLIALLGPTVVERLFGFYHPRLNSLFVVLALGFMVMTWNSTIALLAPASGRQMLMLKTVASAALLSLVLCILLVSAFGMMGAALSTLFTELYVGLIWLCLTLHGSSKATEPLLSSGPPVATLQP